MVGQVPSETEVIGYVKALSNWGRWGPEDELGTINLITPGKRVAAARLVQDGVSVTCARPIVTDISAETTFQVQRFMIDSGEGRDTASPERLLARRGASEFIGMVFHGYAITHIDSPAHFFWEGQLYNGRSCNLVTSREGATVASVELLRDGVVSRGVLLDVARARGVRWLGPGEGVMPADLEAAERAAGLRVESGDILLVRTGHYARRLAEGPINPHQAGSAGPHAALLPWLRERGVAVWGSDTHNDVTPTPYPAMGHPFHIGALVGLGLWLIDNMNLEDLARACHGRGRWEFLLTLAPLRLRNATGSPLNPVALF
ncbi:MAG TPA: cyclase family protein [Methylomirabilota bacterium]|jgi:kynurenine formamidase|nr:cyclase family protein [Methylomirabilota bacterium]